MWVLGLFVFLDLKRMCVGKNTQKDSVKSSIDWQLLPIKFLCCIRVQETILIHRQRLSDQSESTPFLNFLSLEFTLLLFLCQFRVHQRM